MRTVLVAGGAGFIGSHLCDSLVEDYRVVCLDNLGSGRAENVAHLRERTAFTLVEGDVRDPLGPTLSDGGVDPEAIDRVYHMASRASPKDFAEYPVDIALTNGVGTHQVLEFARSVDARVLYASTSEVYGDPEVHPQHEEYRGNVDPRGPRACYDESKRYGETLVTSYAHEYDLDTRTVRIFNTYGPRMRPDDGRVVPTFITQALAGDPLTVYGDGTQTRSFLNVDDLVRGLRAAMTTETSGRAVNVGSTDEITIADLARTTIEVVGTDTSITHESLPEDDPKRRRPDVSRARNLLGWQPEVELETGLERTANWFRNRR